ncbi:MAG: class II aldolase/adducin family protein [Gemmatimonadota bacterium]
MSIVLECAPLADELARYARLCYDRRLVGAAGGNLSVRVPGRDAFIVTASGVALRNVARENLVAVDLEGRKVDGPEGLRPSKEIGFHLSIFRARPAAHAVVHVHPPYCVVFASAREAVPLATVSAVLKLKQALIVAEGDPGSPELCRSVEEAVRAAGADVTVLLLERHGVASWDASLGAAFDNAELAEDTARIAYLQATFHGDGEDGPAGRLVDLTKPVTDQTPYYPTDPPYRVSRASQPPRDPATVSRIDTGVHIGTHVDAPLHFVAGALDIAAMPPASFCGPGVALACPRASGQNVQVADLAGTSLRPGDVVLVHTGWEQRAYGPGFFEGDWPGLSLEAARWLVDRRVRAVGGDFASVDSPSGVAAGAPAHMTFAAAGIPVFEALINLEQLVGRRFWFIGLPLRLVGCEASPVRAVAMVP